MSHPLASGRPRSAPGRRSRSVSRCQGLPASSSRGVGASFYHALVSSTPRRTIEALGVAALTVAVGLITNDARLLLAVAAICALVLLAAEWTWLRTRLPVARPFEVELDALRTKAVETERMPPGDEYRNAVADWDAKFGRRSSAIAEGRRGLCTATTEPLAPRSTRTPPERS